jgi:hypothetical protein
MICRARKSESLMIYATLAPKADFYKTLRNREANEAYEVVRFAYFGCPIAPASLDEL